MKNETINITIDKVNLPGILTLPKDTKTLVIFAHGSGSGRFSPRNNFVSGILNNAGIGTLLFDLLTEEEDLIYQNRFEIDLITYRLVKVTQWLMKNNETKKLIFGYFGASTGAAAALEAATQIDIIQAIVSRGGRPDLAMNVLKKITAPTLLIVGGDDDVVIELNQKAYDQLKSEKKLEIIPGATHLFEEPGTLEKVATLAKDWFQKYLK